MAKYAARIFQRLQLHYKELVFYLIKVIFVFSVFLNFPLCAGHSNDHIEFVSAYRQFAAIDGAEFSIVSLRFCTGRELRASVSF